MHAHAGSQSTGKSQKTGCPELCSWGCVSLSKREEPDVQSIIMERDEMRLALSDRRKTIEPGCPISWGNVMSIRILC